MIDYNPNKIICGIDFIADIAYAWARTDRNSAFRVLKDERTLVITRHTSFADAYYEEQQETQQNETVTDRQIKV